MEPMSRNDLQNFKAQVEEKFRLQQIKDFVSSCYRDIRQRAAVSTVTSAQFELIQPKNTMNTLKFNSKDKSDIQNSLRPLFPDSSIEYKVLPVAESQNTNMSYSKEFLVIDWS
jgi:hypothetical protein